MATNFEDLIPTSVARDFVQAAQEQSAVLALGNTMTMPAGVEKVPVLSVTPTAKFVSPKFAGRKPFSAAEWTSELLEPEEIALTTYIPDAFLDDAGFPVWESVRGAVGGAIALALDALCCTATVRRRRTRPVGSPRSPGRLRRAPDALAAIDAAATEIENTVWVPGMQIRVVSDRGRVAIR